MVLTKDGAVRCRSIKRRPTTDQFSTDLLECHASYLQPNPLKPGEHRVGIKLSLGTDPPDPASTTLPDPVAPRGLYRVKLMLQDFIDFGFTDGCSGCDSRIQNLPYDKL